MDKRSSQYSRNNYARRRGGRTLRRRRRRRRIAALLAAIAVLAVAAFALASPQSPLSKITGEPLVKADMQAAPEPDALPTPIIAECDGVELHSAVAAQSLTEILIHNASYNYAMPLTTQLVEATNLDVMAAHGTGRVPANQPTGDEWMTGEFIRCFRSTNGGPKMSAIDCGGPVGATVYAPVTGEVVLVKQYDLYDNPDHKDYQVHIRPEGRSDLDVVLIHLTDVEVAKGDHVVAGQTSIARIRDVYAWIGESMQLKDYTAEGDNGNHTHIQVNNVNDANYHGLDQ